MASKLRRALALSALAGALAATEAASQGLEWPWLGVTITDIVGVGLGDKGATDGGSYVTNVDHAGPASNAGVARHDIIIAIDGRRAINPRELTCLIQGRRPGDLVQVSIMRGGRPHTMPARLARWPEGRFPPPLLGECGRDRISARPQVLTPA
jgi:S1-C subfamily serine protease